MKWFLRAAYFERFKHDDDLVDVDFVRKNRRCKAVFSCVGNSKLSPFSHYGTLQGHHVLICFLGKGVSETMFIAVARVRIVRIHHTCTY
jgi:hypothetical protein